MLTPVRVADATRRSFSNAARHQLNQLQPTSCYFVFLSQTTGGARGITVISPKKTTKTNTKEKAKTEEKTKTKTKTKTPTLTNETMAS